MCRVSGSTLAYNVPAIRSVAILGNVFVVKIQNRLIKMKSTPEPCGSYDFYCVLYTGGYNFISHVFLKT